MDIEHYRPKGAIIELDPSTYKPYRKSKKVPALKPGYYWLAANWENLRPSCIIAIGFRTREYLKVGEGGDRQRQLLPLTMEIARASTQHHALRNEQPLLLNPCNDDPEYICISMTKPSIFGDTGARRCHSSKC